MFVQNVYSESEYTINYYIGNGTSTSGVSKIGTSKCTYGKECSLLTFAYL